jgi:hypothetical protein
MKWNIVRVYVNGEKYATMNLYGYRHLYRWNVWWNRGAPGLRTNHNNAVYKSFKVVPYSADSWDIPESSKFFQIEVEQEFEDWNLVETISEHEEEDEKYQNREPYICNK